MLSATDLNNQKWTIKDLATPELINEYVSCCKYGDNSEPTQATRDYIAKFLIEEVEALKQHNSGKYCCTMEDIGNKAVYLVAAFEAGARWGLEKAYKIINERFNTGNNK